MMKRERVMKRVASVLMAVGCGFAGCDKKSGRQDPPAAPATVAARESQGVEMSDKVVKTDEEWRKQLSPEAYQIARKKGTERAFTGRFWNHKADGTYTCVGCNATLFESTTKFDSGCGWPSFFEPANKGNVEFHEDRTLGMVRTEVTCKRCGAHLGHVFDDGPAPTGQRFCINSASLNFESAEKQGESTANPSP